MNLKRSTIHKCMLEAPRSSFFCRMVKQLNRIFFNKPIGFCSRSRRKDWKYWKPARNKLRIFLFGIQAKITLIIFFLNFNFFLNKYGLLTKGEVNMAGY